MFLSGILSFGNCILVPDFCCKVLLVHKQLCQRQSKTNTLGGSLLNPSKGKHVLNRAESHRCEVNTLEILACNFSTFLKVYHWGSFTKFLTESERSDRVQSEKFIKIIEYVSYSIRYCKIILLIYSGSSSLETSGFFYSPSSHHKFQTGVSFV